MQAAPAQARNVEEAEKAKEARRAALRAAAEQSAQTGVGAVRTHGCISTNRRRRTRACEVMRFQSGGGGTLATVLRA